MKILNIAAYKFIELHNLEALKQDLRNFCDKLGLKGTILLSPEGINLMLAGAVNTVISFKRHVETGRMFSNLEYKESYSEQIPFKRMWVKIKREIIPMRATVNVDSDTAPQLSPHTFKQWLDEKRDITVLDVRNHYEILFGAFKEADELHIYHFNEFSEAAQSHLKGHDKNKPIVMYCTGGIRCEKASALLRQQGFSHVYQLEGGILNYFAVSGDVHYQGDCYVFDERVALNANLQPAGVKQCSRCSAPVSHNGVCLCLDNNTTSG